ncbi:MAG: 4-alpha-glucanotransferase [Xanthobacteraceae bacterium]
MSAEHIALDELARRMGIEPEFRDARGKIVAASSDTKRQLLAAMGVEADDEEEAGRALERLEQSEWLRPLPPVIVVSVENGPPIVTLVLPADTRLIDWRLTCEDGQITSARIAFSDLELAAERSFDGRPLQRRLLPLRSDIPLGYHRLTIEPGEGSMAVVVSPRRCFLPPDLAAGQRIWGLAAQLYLLRSQANWGIGDFADLDSLVEIAAARGADVVGLNPLHALFPDDPEHASPYSPASRLLLNVLNIDVAAAADLSGSREAQELIRSDPFRQRLAAAREQPLVDYSGVTALKMQVLQLLFAAFATHANEPSRREFERYRREGGPVLERNCLFLALRGHFAAEDPSHADWHRWPQPYRDPSSPAVAKFAAEHRQRLAFFVWLQWLADAQLGQAAETARQRGMRIGLYRDLAVGADRSGAETWANAAAVVSGAQVGAPPDIFNPAGQDWGLPPLHPLALREEAYASFVQLVRANMRHAGGLRIDHVMGLQHLYWVPLGAKPSAGAYVRYPMDDLIGILALESHRHRCIVVGEDLGTVPEGFRERMAAANILSYRVLFFEQSASDGEFLPPGEYPVLALAVAGSHDLPTLRGWWEERDVDIKEELGLYPDRTEGTQQRESRKDERAKLLAALRREQLLPPGAEPDIPTLARAVHSYLARTPALLAIAQIDDLTDEADPVNVPATSDEHPNWRRRLSMTLSELSKRPRFIDIAAIFEAERGRTRPPQASDQAMQPTARVEPTSKAPQA